MRTLSPPGRGSAYVKEHKFISAFLHVKLRKGRWVAGIPEVPETDALYYTAVLYVKAWDDPFCQHFAASASASAGSRIAS